MEPVFRLCSFWEYSLGLQSNPFSEPDCTPWNCASVWSGSSFRTGLFLLELCLSELRWSFNLTPFRNQTIPIGNVPVGIKLAFDPIPFWNWTVPCKKCASLWSNSYLEPNCSYCNYASLWSNSFLEPDCSYGNSAGLCSDSFLELDQSYWNCAGLWSTFWNWAVLLELYWSLVQFLL